jgi:hypothetical protein
MSKAVFSEPAFSGTLQGAMSRLSILCWMLALAPALARDQPSLPGKAPTPRFRVLALMESGGHHVAFTAAAKPWLKVCGEENGFAVDYITNTIPITEELLARYRLVLQLDFAPYGWTPEAMAAFKAYIEQGKGGWVGLHHATLLGDFDGQPMWPWFSQFMGGIKFKNYIATFSSGKVRVEDKTHPCMKDVPESFVISKEEWYTYDIMENLWPMVHAKFSAEEIWGWCREALSECSRYAAAAGVTLALQNHRPVIKDYHDVLRMVREVDSPHVKACLDAPLMLDKSPKAMHEAARAVGPLQVLSHFGGEFERRGDGSIRGFERNDGVIGGETNQYYRDFVAAMRGIGYEGYLSYELCHQLPLVDGKTVGIEFAHQNAKLAAEFMRQLFKS